MVLASEESFLCSVDPFMDNIGKLITEHNKKVIITQVQEDKEDLKYLPDLRTYVPAEKHAKTDADNLSEMLYIGPKKDKNALKSATQRGT